MNSSGKSFTENQNQFSPSFYCYIIGSVNQVIWKTLCKSSKICHPKNQLINLLKPDGREAKGAKNHLFCKHKIGELNGNFFQFKRVLEENTTATSSI